MSEDRDALNERLKGDESASSELHNKLKQSQQQARPRPPLSLSLVSSSSDIFLFFSNRHLNFRNK